MIGLKTAKGTKQLKLDPSIYESLQKEKVEVGDVIYIEANSGAVKVGRNPEKPVFLFCLIWGRNRATFPIPKKCLFFQLLTESSQLENLEKF